MFVVLNYINRQGRRSVSADGGFFMPYWILVFSILLYCCLKRKI